MISALAGGCFQPEDTFVNYGTGSVVSVAGVGPGGGEVTTPESAREFFEQEVFPDMELTCGNSVCHSSGEVAFLQDGYETIKIWTTKVVVPGSPFVGVPPEQSILIAYPDSSDHMGANWTEAPEGLRANTAEWLRLENLNIDPEAPLEVGPVDPEGLVVLPMDSLAPELVGFTMSFYATEHGSPPELLELTQISIWPPNGLALKAVNPTFIGLPNINISPVVDTSFHGDPEVFVAPSNVVVGPGELLLTTWGDEWELKVRFDDLSVLFADDDGNTFAPCTRVDLFIQGVETTGDGGLEFCATQCHGGNNGNAPTQVMNLSELLDGDTANDAFACAKTRVFITPTNPGGSQIITTTDPLGTSAHLYSFGGDTTAHVRFRNGMTEWINEEGAEP